MSSEHSTPTTPDRPQDSPNNVELHEAQLLRAEEAQVGSGEGGQGVQCGLVQLAPSHYIAGNEGGHLWEEATQWCGAGRDISPGACTTSHPVQPPGLYHLTLCAPQACPTSNPVPSPPHLHSQSPEHPSHALC